MNSVNLLRYFSHRTIRAFGARALEKFVLDSMADAAWTQGLSIELKVGDRIDRAKIKRATFAGARECRTKLVAQYRALVELSDGVEQELIVEKLHRCPEI